MKTIIQFFSHVFIFLVLMAVVLIPVLIVCAWRGDKPGIMLSYIAEKLDHHVVGYITKWGVWNG